MVGKKGNKEKNKNRYDSQKDKCCEIEESRLWGWELLKWVWALL